MTDKDARNGPARNSPFASGHDAFFKDLMSEPEAAQQFFQDHLPAVLVAHFIDEPPERVSGSFVDEKLVPSHTDILYRVQLRGGEDVFIYTLFEHKSTPDPYVALQLLRYQTRIWSQLVKEGARRPLPNIIPIVVYHGDAAWSYAPYFKDMLMPFPAAGELDDEQFDFKYRLIDLSQIPDDELSENPRLASFLRALKYARHSDMESRLRLILAFIDDLSRLDFIRLITYIITVNPQSIDEPMLNRVLEHVAPDKRRKS